MNDQANLYDPALMVRGDDGQGWHPHLPFPDTAEMDADESVDISAEIKAQGYEYDRVAPREELDGVEEGGDAYWAALRAWQPAAPDDSGRWILVAVADTEDGPFAWFVRKLEATA